VTYTVDIGRNARRPCFGQGSVTGPTADFLYSSRIRIIVNLTIHGFPNDDSRKIFLAAN
jgi:hypothetical protein